jgi:signal peptidase II
MEATTERDASLRPAVVLAATAVALYVLDQVTKALVVANLGIGESVPVVGDLVRLWHVRNTGAAFSLLPGAFWLFIPVTVIALGMVAWFHRSLRDRTRWVHVILGMILAGTLGNLTDRLRLGSVVDFVSVGFGDVRFPTFNVADSSLVVGIGLLVVYLTFVDRADRDTGTGEPAA